MFNIYYFILCFLVILSPFIWYPYQEGGKRNLTRYLGASAIFNLDDTYCIWQTLSFHIHVIEGAKEI